MRFLYTILIKLYYFIIYIASFFNEKAEKWIHGRKETAKILKKELETQPFYWFHCASLGEFEQARPLIEKLKKEYNKNIVVTFFSPSGFEARKNYPFADIVLYMPLDTISNAHQFIKRFAIQKAFFVKYEFWFNFLYALKNKNIPTYLISGVFRKEQIFFKPYGNWFKKQLSAFTLFFVQNKASEKILKSQGFSNIIVSGDTRFDTVWENKLRAKPNPLIEQFKGESKLLIAGSCWEPEEDILITCLNNNFIPDGWKIIFVPHDVSNKHITRIIQNLKQPVGLYSQKNIQTQVLIIDTIGELANTYQYGDVAFIGGGFKNALHNILEPATFGLPVIFGPNHKKYPEAKMMMQNGSAFEVCNVNEFKSLINKFNTPSFLNQEKIKNAQFIERYKGAVNKILNNINV
jgi:3-deoxy-D-manno-octulosonic-acid transferase